MKTKSFTTVILIYLISSLVTFSQGVDNNNINSTPMGLLNIADSLMQVTENIADSIKTDSIADSIITDTIAIKDSLLYKTLNYQHDTTKKVRPKGGSILNDNIDYTADDSTIYSIDGKKVYLFGNANIKYEDIDLTAAYIEVDMEKNILYAEGVKDSLGKLQGQPVFTQAGETMQAKSITYNVQTQKGYIKGLYAEQDEGYLHSENTKKEPDNFINLQRGKYTTCDLENPHFYLWISRGKVIPDKAIVAGYSFLVIEDVPLYPLMVPFGFFPTTKEKASGFLIPKFGEEVNRGFYLREGGYYFSINDYVDLAVKGDIYSKGSWLVNAQSKYKLKYKFSGNVDIAYSKVIFGEPGLVNYNESNEYRVKWSHTQDPKARLNSNFSANVNFTSRGENKYNPKSAEEYLTNTTSSSISYRKKFANTPFSTSVNLKHSQNIKTGDIQLNLPQMTFNMSRIFPFRKKVAVGKAKWYENIGVVYSGNFQNKSDGLNDSVMFKQEMWDHFKNGIQHKIPLSTSLKVLKHVNFTPSINFTDRMYFERTMLNNEEYINAEGKLDTMVVEDVQKGFYNVYDYNTSIGFGTIIYGMFNYKSKWLKAIRHVATPNVSFSYRPDFQESQWGYYHLRPDDTTGNNYYSPYTGSIYGVPGSGKSGMLNLSLNNNIEMKVVNKKDTVNNETKIKLLESLNFSTSYNLMADSMNWTPLIISARTTLFKVLSINMSAVGNPYAIDTAGKLHDEFNFMNNPRQLFRITNARISTGFSLNSKKLFKKNKSEEGEPENDVSDIYGHYNYEYFDIPWNIRIQYSLSYSKPGIKSKVSQSLTFSGDFSLTPKWKIGFRSGYDLENMDFTYTNFNLSRDLHCWVATLSIIPFGLHQSYNFSIGVKSQVLQDLKYKKDQSWIDNAY